MGSEMCIRDRLLALAKGESVLLAGVPAASHIILDMLLAILPALAPWPRALLPAVYPLWAPLLQLVSADDRSVSAHAMRVFVRCLRLDPARSIGRRCEFCS